MKAEVHPQYKDVTVTCSCGNSFVTRSTLGKESLLLEVCAKCHPFYTGTQKMVDTAGRVDRFRQKYGMKGKNAAAETKEAAKAEASVKTEEAPAKAEAAPEAKKTEAKKKPAAKKAADKDAKKD